MIFTHPHILNNGIVLIHIVRPQSHPLDTKKTTENPPPLPTTLPPMGQAIRTTSTFQSGPVQKREFHTQSSTFRSGAGQVGPGSRSTMTVTSTSSLNNQSPVQSATLAGNWQSPRYGSNSLISGSVANPNSYHVGSVNNNNNNHQYNQHFSGNNSFLANERSAAAVAAG